MIEKIRKLFLLFYFILSLFFMEALLRASTTGNVFSFGFIFSFIFSTSLAAVFYLICTFFNEKANRILSSVLLVLTALIFCSQMIYFKCFKTFYTLYSAGNASQIFEFWRDIVLLVVRNLIWIILIFLPVILILTMLRKEMTFGKIDMKLRGLLVLGIILSHLTGLGVVYVSGRGEYSPYGLYYNSSNPIASTDKLGLLTTMRLDLQRLTLGWSPDFELAPDSVSVLAPVEVPGGAAEGQKVEYNTMNIDFASLISNEKNENIKGMHKYFQAVQPTEKNEYTGKYKGYNLILITAEGFSPYAVRADVTPTLYKMVQEGYKFTNFYNPIWGVSTSDGEYVACTGLIPKSGVWSFQKSGNNYLPLVMGNQLKSLGYKTNAYHDHSYTFYGRNISHPNMGYTFKALGKGLNLKKTWPESDLEMMEKTVPEYAASQPFHTYYMTVSGHLRYSFVGNSMSAKNKKYVENLPYSESSRAYIAAQIELDRALESLLKQLEAAGTLDKTLIALSPDHYPYGLEEKEIDELAGHKVEKNFELYKSTFILYTKGMKPVTIDKPCSSLDILPTLSNLLGLEYDSRLLMGRDIFSKAPPLVIFSNRSFITDKGRYNALTGEFIPESGAVVPEGYVKGVSGVVNAKFYYSARILDTDYYRKVIRK